MIDNEITAWCSWIECSTCVAPRLRSDAIDFTPLSSCKVTFRAARRVRLACERTGSNAHPAEFAGAILGLLCIRAVLSDQSIDTLIGARRGLPIGFTFAYPGDRSVRPRLHRL